LIIIHSHELEADWTPKIEYKSRLDKAIEIIKDETKNKFRIILPWWKATEWINVRHCDSGYKYLLENWISEEILLIEDNQYNSLETVWEAIFAYNSFKDYFYSAPSIDIISSDYHEKRIMAIQSFVLWRLSSRLSFTWIDKEVHKNYSRTLEQEENSLKAFYNTFSWIEEWDIEKINKKLYKSHPLYKKIH
jgi:protoheme ferro-lyase